MTARESCWIQRSQHALVDKLLELFMPSVRARAVRTFRTYSHSKAHYRAICRAGGVVGRDIAASGNWS